MAHSSGSPQEGQSDSTANIQTQADKKDTLAGSPEPQRLDDGQRKPSDCSDVLQEENIPNDKYDACQYQSPFSKSLQKAEALLSRQLNPRLRWLTRQKSKNGSWDSESESVSSCSSRHIQQLGQTLQSLSSQCHTLRDPASGGRLIGCVKGLSVSGWSDFYYHPQTANFSLHYCQLQCLMEQRAQLLFLHEYAQRTHTATCFVGKLGMMLERMRLLADRGRVAEQPYSVWNFSLRAMCQELQVHVNHWECLWARACSYPHSQLGLFSHLQMLSSMQQTLYLLDFQALELMERCIQTAFSALAAAQLNRVPRDALVDLLCAVELYNQVVEEKRSQSRTFNWRSQLLLSSDWPQVSPGLLRISTGPKKFPVEQLMMILAQSQAQKVAEQLYIWTSQQSDLLYNANDPTKQRGQLEYHKLNSRLSSPTINIHIVHLEAQAAVEEPPKKLLHSHWSSDLPFSAFIIQDRECLNTFFKVLMSSTNLLALRIPMKPQLDRTVAPEDPIGIYCSLSEESFLNRPNVISRSNMIPANLSKSDACVKLICHYKTVLWREFGEAAVRHFYYQPYSSTLGSINQWNEDMVLRLVTWLRHSYTEDLIPEECKESLKSFCSYISSTAAFTSWDKMMCLSLGSGLKEKCVPGTQQERSVRTATMNLILQLFTPLHTVVQELQHSDMDSDDSGLKGLTGLYLGLLYRSVTTVQTSSFWVMSKAYQFLASWTLSKFLLVTQGDLKDLRSSVETLIQLAGAYSRNSAHPLIIQQTALLTYALTDLQAFSDLVLKIFSVDCKKMSMEIFEQTMPSAKHWRLNHKTVLPSSPSDYALCAAQSIIGQVLEGVRPLPDEVCVPALSEAMTAFMEAWMEHILKKKIRFSVHGALQLKQDFELIRQLIGSDRYSLSEELHQKLLSLRVFQQVDNAIVCLLQQPVDKVYLPSRSWEPFRHCCSSSAQVMDQTPGSLNNLDSMDIQAACQQALTRVGSSMSPELLPSTPPESYLAVAQQEWLDLRIHGGSRWKLPALECFTKSEP